MQNVESGHKIGNENGSIFVANYPLVRVYEAITDCISTYPIACVWQSVAGAIAVMGSKIVLAEICSEVEGSKTTTVPWALPWTC